MSYDSPPERNRVVSVTSIGTAKYLCERLMLSSKAFEFEPNVDGELTTFTFKLTSDDADYAVQQLQEWHGKLVVNYKGHSIRCYGRMSEDQNVWWATEDDEGIVTRGFESWDAAVRHFIDEYEIPAVELGAV